MTWLLPLLILVLTTVLSVPLGLYMARVLDRGGADAEPTRFGRGLGAVEQLIDTGPQNWKAYCVSMLAFNAVLFLLFFAVLATQPWHPAFLNPDGKKMLAPSTIFNTACSFLSNTNLQHYSGEVHLSYFSQIVAILYDQFVTPAVGLAALLAVIRGLRGDKHLGNFYLDVWRGTVYVLLPLALVVGLLLVAGGVPMTLEGAQPAATLEGGDNSQTLARGPAAAVVAIKQLGTNGGGFFGANSAHPFENPNAWTNVVECVSIILVPWACLVMFGRMLRNVPHAVVIAGVMAVLLVSFLVWGVANDTHAPNPALAGRPALRDADGKKYAVDYRDADGKPGKKDVDTDELPALPVDQDGFGNLEGKELRFGPSAGPTWAAITTCTSNGSVNCMHDSLNPLAGLTPLMGMWLSCIAPGGVGVGLINLLIYLVVGVFLAGLMVGRTPEYLGKKVEAKEMKLASLALLAHPLMILLPTGLFVALSWGPGAMNNPGAHGFSEVVYEFSSSSANNGSGFEGLGDTYGYYVPDTAQPKDSPFVNPADNPVKPADYSIHFDIACGLVMLISRFVPIVAPIALAASLSGKRPTPFTSGTLRTDTVTFGFLLLGTILLVGALLFLPAALLGPVAEHLGPIPFGG
jgi:K+-transporting ATPase ATPase A chain